MSFHYCLLVAQRPMSALQLALTTAFSKQCNNYIISYLKKISKRLTQKTSGNNLVTLFISLKFHDSSMRLYWKIIKIMKYHTFAKIRKTRKDYWTLVPFRKTWAT